MHNMRHLVQGTSGRVCLRTILVFKKCDLNGHFQDYSHFPFIFLRKDGINYAYGRPVIGRDLVDFLTYFTEVSSNVFKRKKNSKIYFLGSSCEYKPLTTVI